MGDLRPQGRVAPPDDPEDPAVVEIEIASRAYDYWLLQGRPEGTELKDWLRAESDLRRVRELARRLNEALIRLKAEHDVAAVLATSSTMVDAAPQVLAVLCQSLGWDAALFWRALPRTGGFQCLGTWREPALADEFVIPDQPCTIAAGQSVFGPAGLNREPVWIAHLESAPSFPGKSFLVDAGLKSVVSVPVGDAGGSVGMVELFSRSRRGPSPDLLSTLASIGGHVAQFFERRQAEARLSGWEQEAELARAIQQGLLPHARPELVEFEFGSGSLPALLTGGDFLDYFPFPDGTLAVAIGDASGHGIAASLLMAETRAYLRALALTHTDVGRILTLVNQRLAEDTGCSSFVTLFLCRLDPVSRRLVYTNAGHWPAYVFDRDGQIRAKLGSTNIPLSLDPESRFDSAVDNVTLQPGDLLFLFTDGILEAFGGDRSLFGLSRTLEYVRTHRHESPDAIIAGLFSEVLHHAGHAIFDDMSSLIIKVREDG